MASHEFCPPNKTILQMATTLSTMSQEAMWEAVDTCQSEMINEALKQANPSINEYLCPKDTPHLFNIELQKKMTDDKLSREEMITIIGEFGARYWNMECTETMTTAGTLS